MFELDGFIHNLRACLPEKSRRAVKEVVAEAVRDPESIIRALGRSEVLGAQVLYRGDDLTVVNVLCPLTDYFAAQPPQAGDHPALPRTRGQPFLTKDCLRARVRDRSHGRPGLGKMGCGPARAGHHPHRGESPVANQRRQPCVRPRLRGGPLDVRSRDADGTSVRRQHRDQEHIR